MMNDERLDDLAPCPFCGGEACGDGEGDSWWIGCLKCDARGPLFWSTASTADDKAFERARDGWNKRAAV